ncbi:MAG: hypothetical protein R3360_01275, partial [Alphaproteobacteria bacterium]|nr:hypothetical protein [Alphaproteobacteria bacterium]
RTRRKNCRRVAVMAHELDELRHKLDELESEFEEKLQERQKDFRYQVRNNRVVFEKAMVREHRKLKEGLISFLRRTHWSVLIIAPLTYAMAVPLVLLDLFVTVYQAGCFPILGIRKVRRSQYIRLDRGKLAYLNGLQKFNCLYCGYANGLIAYTREIAGRTEQYWCPIKHALRVKAPHPHYKKFLDYGDAEGFRHRLQDLREDLKDSEKAA